VEFLVQHFLSQNRLMHRGTLQITSLEIMFSRTSLWNLGKQWVPNCCPHNELGTKNCAPNCNSYKRTNIHKNNLRKKRERRHRNTNIKPHRNNLKFYASYLWHQSRLQWATGIKQHFRIPKKKYKMSTRVNHHLLKQVTSIVPFLASHWN
jgi:hypothetical protein